MNNVRFLLMFIVVAQALSCNTIKDVEFIGLKSYEIEKVGFEKTKISSQIEYYNPNRFGVVLTNLYLDFFLDGTKIGHSNQNISVSVPSRSKFLIPLVAELDTKSALKKTLSSLFKDKVKVHVVGYVRVKKAGISKMIPVDYNFEQSVSLF